MPAGSPIFSGARKNGVFTLGTWGTEIHPSIAPQPEHFMIVKHRVSAGFHYLAFVCFMLHRLIPIASSS